MSPFEKAFAAARKAGKKEFTFNGKSYHTKLKEEMGGAGGSTTRPKRNPNRPPSVMSEAPKMGAAPAKAKPVTISDKKPVAKTEAPKKAAVEAPKKAAPAKEAKKKPSGKMVTKVGNAGLSGGKSIIPNWLKPGGGRGTKKQY